MGIFEKLFGTYSEKEIKRIIGKVDAIEAMEPEIEKLSDSELRAKTDEFKKRLADGEKVDDILVEAFAVCREAGKRVLGQRAFRTQLIGGIIIHQGRIAEMKTGEGKTLVSVFPAYLNALTGRGVHVVTVNEYLAKRDSEWMGKIHRFLGLTVGVIYHALNNQDRQAAYNCDITYGTNNEFGFDYLRDNMVIYKEQMVQRELNYAIVDEIDSILIDEARTPLIISGPAEKSTEMYTIANNFAKNLKAKVIKESDDKNFEEFDGYDYVVDEKAKTTTLTDAGIKKAEKFFNIENLSDPENLTISHHINQAIKAHGLFKLDINYVVKDGEVIIVDEFTGRLMYGRRYSEGLHQAIEAKEGVKVERESKTFATITFQNYFRMYRKLSGMTGTAMTEDEEFRAIYKLDVVEIPTNKPLIRKDNRDVVYKNEKGKFNAVIEDIIESHEKGQPVLVGTVSIEKSEILSEMLKRKGIKHEVLNAKYHEKEAEIVAQAGKFGAITIATNMAGRGTDIMLGGNAEFLARQEMRKEGYSDELIESATGFNETTDQDILNARKVFKEFYDKFKKQIDEEHEKVIAVGGLKIIGTERHESRRIDNQLRGRAGRQGDPGETRFYISLEDDLMRLFGSDKIMSMVDRLGLEDDMPIELESPVLSLSKTIENAQKRIESRNFMIRKHVLQYDDVMNKQRETIYGERRKVLDGEDLKESITKMIKVVVQRLMDSYMPEALPVSDWNEEGLREQVKKIFALDISDMFKQGFKRYEIHEKLEKAVLDLYELREQNDFGSERMRELERVIMLTVVDQKWMDHIDDMEQLKDSVRLRGYGQRDPVIEYQMEGFDMFEEMNENIQQDTIKILYHLRKEKNVERRDVVAESVQNIGGDGTVSSTVKSKKKPGRNDPCPCGSGKKYKQCCGK